MSQDPGRTPDTGRPPERGGFPAPPWGLAGTALGIVATFYLWLMIIFASVLVVSPEAPLEQAPAATRFGLMLAFEIGFLAVPLAFAAFTGGGRASLGLRPLRRSAAVEASGAAVLLVAFGWAYSEALRWAAPGLHEKVMAEQAEQLQLLAGPLPLLFGMAVVVAPIAEELFFRGFVFGGLRGKLPFAYASGLSAALFALAHGMLHNALPLFAVGLVTAALYERRRSLFASILVHAGYNLISILVELAVRDAPPV